MAEVREYMTEIHRENDPNYFSARALVDHRPLKALLVQEGLINNHPFTIFF